MRMLILSEFVFFGKALSNFLACVAPVDRLLDALDINEFSAHYPGILPDIILVVIRWDPAAEHKIFRGLAQISSIYPQSRIIAYTDAPLHLSKRILRHGVLGYLTHNAISEDFATCVLAAATGRKFMETDVLASLLGRIKPEDQPAVQAKFKTLSPREQLVAKMLTSHENIKDIASKMQLNKTSVFGIRKRIFSKLNIANISMLAQIIRLVENPQV